MTSSPLPLALINRHVSHARTERFFARSLPSHEKPRHPPDPAPSPRMSSNPTLRRALCSIGGGPMIGSQPLHLSRHGHAPHSHARARAKPLFIRPPLGTYSYIVVIIQDFECRYANLWVNPCRLFWEEVGTLHRITSSRPMAPRTSSRPMAPQIYDQIQRQHRKAKDESKEKKEGIRNKSKIFFPTRRNRR